MRLTPPYFLCRRTSKDFSLVFKNSSAYPACFLLLVREKTKGVPPMRPKKYNTPHRSRVVKTRMTMRNIKTSPPVLLPTIWAKQSLSGKPYELWGTYPHPLAWVCRENHRAWVQLWRERHTQTGHWDLLQLCRQGGLARSVSPTYPTRKSQVPDRNGKIFYTSIASLSHINKCSGSISFS